MTLISGFSIYGHANCYLNNEMSYCVKFVEKWLSSKSGFGPAAILLFVFFLSWVSPAYCGETDAYYFSKVGDWKKAVAAFSAVLRENPQTADFNKAAEAYYYYGKLDSAEDAAKKALERSDRLGSRVILLLVMAKKGRPDEALKELESLKKNTSDDYKIFTAMGMIKLPDDSEAALSFFNRALEKNTDDFFAWFNIGLIYEEDESFENATKAYKN